MRKLAVLSALALMAAAGAAFAGAGGGHAASKPGLSVAAAKTDEASSVRYAIRVRLTRHGVSMALHIRGQAAPGTVSVAMRMSDLALDDGTVVRGASGAALLDGPFLYERAPSNAASGGLASDGAVRWQRLAVWALPAGSPDLQAIKAMTPTPLLHMLQAAHVASRAPGIFHGSIAYDDAAIRRLSRLIGNLQFRHLRVSAVLGRDDRVHLIVLTGRTPDGATRLSLRARLFAFERPLHVTPPKPAAIVDEQLAKIPA